MDEIVRASAASPATVRCKLREAGLPAISALNAQMRCLHALWAWESGRVNFWSSAGFRTLAEVSEFLSRNTGAPVGRWKTAGGFAALLRQVVESLCSERLENAGSA